VKIKQAVAAAVLAGTLAITGCSSDADVVSKNLSKDADNFKIDRRIVFYNGITGDYILEIEGRCSVDQADRQLSVTCKTGDDDYKKHFLGLSDNVTYFSEQILGAYSNPDHYTVIFKPSVIVPSIQGR
jgi:hypothetical protein